MSSVEGSTGDIAAEVCDTCQGYAKHMVQAKNGLLDPVADDDLQRLVPLLAQARAQNLKAVEGLGMLLHQAVPGFAAWFGLTPVVDEDLYRIVAA